ncbi:MAG: ABC transporter permease subunit [Eubacterium sp.]|nr:ABC transporter permease subunit [Eubacterium sp.]
MKAKKATKFVLNHILLLFLAVVWLIPIVWLVFTAFSAYSGVDTAHFFPEAYSLDNFNQLVHPNSVVQYSQWFFNTLIIAIFTCIISTIFVLMVSYAFSCTRFRGRQSLMSFSMILNMFPGVLSMIIIYFVLKTVGLTNSHVGMIIVYSAGSGLGYLIVKGFMDTIPASLREVAKMEGASELTVFIRIVLPICKPIIVYQIISSFLVPWGDFVFANLMLNSGISKDFTVAIGLYHMLDRSLINQYFGVFCAGGLVVSVPIAILFVIMQKYYVAGVASGSVKG